MPRSNNPKPSAKPTEEPLSADGPSVPEASSPAAGPVDTSDDSSANDRVKRAGTMFAALERLHSATSYGPSTLRFMSELPKRAVTCLLPDGTRTNARIVTFKPGWRAAKDEGRTIDPSECVWQRALPNSQLSLRGRVLIDVNANEVGPRFLNDLNVGIDWGRNEEKRPSLERDLAVSVRIMDLCRSEVFATLFYAALCNTTWRHATTGSDWHCSWRYAGGVLAYIRDEGDYLDWYCSGSEGMVDERVLPEIEALEWTLLPEKPTNDPDEW